MKWILRAALPALLLAGLVAGPVTAAKPQPVATAILADRNCAFAVSYSWSKFSGRKLIATVGLYERIGSVDQGISVQSLGDHVGRTGSVSFLLSLTADTYPSGRTLVAIGSLTDSRTSQQVPGSSDESPTIVSTCG